MDILEFLARSEWPLLTAIALWFARRPIMRMLDRAASTKTDTWSARAEFEKRIDKVDILTAMPVAEVRNATLRVVEKRASAADRLAFMLKEEQKAQSDLAVSGERSTVTAELVVLQSWARLEHAMRAGIAARSPRESRQDRSAPLRIGLAARVLGLGRDEVAALRELRMLRDSVAHSEYGGVTDLAADRFKVATEWLLARLIERQQESRDAKSTA